MRSSGNQDSIALPSEHSNPSRLERAIQFGSKILPFFTPVMNMVAPILNSAVGAKAALPVVFAGTVTGNLAALSSTVDEELAYQKK